MKELFIAIYLSLGFQAAHAQTEDDSYNPKRQILKNVAICSVTCHSEIYHGHDLAIVGEISYAPATHDTLSNRWLCEDQAKTITVYNDRMQAMSDQTCVDALVGKYAAQAVDIDNDTPQTGDNEEFNYVFTITPKWILESNY